MKRIFSIAMTLTILIAAFCQAGEIGFIEDFSLAGDRSIPLKQLIPGTESYYYYHCLHYQNNEQYDKVDEMLTAWIKRYKYTKLVNEIRYRQALLTYEKDPQKSLEFIRRELGIHFNHQRERLNYKPNLPTVLNQDLISRKALSSRAFKRYKNLQGFEDSALDWLVLMKLEPNDRRHLLQRLTRPDHDNLSALIVADLKQRYSRGFGSMGIHRNLLLPQLDKILRLHPSLLNQTHYVNTYLTKLHPANDIDRRHNPEAFVAYLDRLWEFVERLAPVHNSLKAHVMYHRLVHDRSVGVYEKERFMTYISLPRNVSYIEKTFIQTDEAKKWPVNLNANYQAQTMLPPIGNDEPLVRSYLHHFFINEKSYRPYSKWINDLYLKHNFAETKIVKGLGEPEQWYSMLPPATYQALKERIDLDFVFTNKNIFGPDEPVRLDLHVKNVSSLIVKVYEINTQNFYRESLREIDTDINLDGLVAKEEKTYEYNEPQLRRVKRHFEFPQCKGRGVYVIDFIGNGKSSRALVRKGKLRFLTRTSTAGHIFTILDENNQKLPKATLWLSGHQYKPDDEGLITVPFSNQPGRQPIILSSGSFSSLDHFGHESENYSLTAGIYVDRQSLLNRKKAQVVIRPSLSLNGVPVTLKVLEDVSLTLTSTDHDGISSSKEVSDFELHEDRESTYEFTTPKRLASITFTLKAKVKNLSQNKKIDLLANQSFTLNEIDRTEKIEDMHFAMIEGSYVIDILGKTGEVKPDRRVNLSIKHRDFKNLVNVSLKSDANGRVHLGKLHDISQVTATSPGNTSHTWNLRQDAHSHYQSLHGLAGGVIEIPFMGNSTEPIRSDISLLELRGNTFVADRFGAIKIENGLIKVNKLPRGDYDLLLKRNGTRIKLRLSEGVVRDNYVLSKNRQLEVRGGKPLQIDRIKTTDKHVSVSLRNSTEYARVHVFASQYRPAYSVYDMLSRVTDAEPFMTSLPKAETLYLAGRNIGDEFRYIIDRRYANKYPGNMLEKPTLLLNPWAIRKTETGQQQAAPGEDLTSQGKDNQSAGGRSQKKQPASTPPKDFANLDFLSDSTAVIVNLAPNEEGIVNIDRILFGANQHVHVVVCDPTTTVYRSVSLPEIRKETNDLRLLVGLDPERHFTQKKQITVVDPESEFEIPDITTSRFEAYDNLSSIYRLFATLSRDPKLLEFSFILTWDKLKPEEKQTLYSKYACHELAFFIAQKDPEFFNQAIKPYLANKKDKTFLDDWLLGDEAIDKYLKPWNHDQLNIVERILLGRRIETERRHTARHVEDLFDLIPPNMNHFNHLFNTALKGSALETKDNFGFAGKRSEVIDSLSEELSESLNRFAAPSVQAANGAIVRGYSMGGAALGVKAEDESEALRKGVRQTENAPAAAEGDMYFDKQKSAEAKKLKLAENESRTRARRALSFKESADFAYYDANDLTRRKYARQLYRKLDKTQEWVENNYYKLPISQQNAQLVTVNSFWNDYASHNGKQPFYSSNFAEASRSFTEMMFAISVLDLPAEPPKHESNFDGKKMTLKSAGPIVAYHEEIKSVSEVAENTPILVSQNFFRQNDRYRHEYNERFDKYVTEEFLVHTVYGCQVVVTNPTSSPRKIDVLLQVPVGALPVMNSQETRSLHINLAPYNTQTVEYYFYFPAAGKYPHYPVHVAQNEQLMAFAKPFTFNVVLEPSQIDRTSWAYISQYGSDEDVIEYMKANNLNRTMLDKIAFRMHDKSYFQKITNLLSQRHVYNHTLWSYGIKHNDIPGIREYLQHANKFVARCGDYIDSPLLSINPVIRKSYEHMEYKPLVNARAHQLGRRRQILNNRLEAQYNRLLKILSYKRDLNSDEMMAITYYMLLQDRIEGGIDFFNRVNVDDLEMRMQYDYTDAYVALYLENTQQARDIAERYADCPIDRWRNAFTAISTQLDEIEGADTSVIDDQNRTEVQTNLAASQPNFDFKVEAKKVSLNYQNLSLVTINYYLMDIELLFSRNPFVQQYTGQFSYITPNQTELVELPTDKTNLTFDLPENLHNSNVLVEIKAAGLNKQQAYYSNSINLQTIENYGQVRVSHEKTNRPIPKTYVKVYAQMKDGSVKFYKDGYTDLRGRFDYTSLNTNELEFVQKFSLLVLSDEYGAVVREADPPKR